MALAACFSSDRTDWETPPELFDALDREFGFTLDACALSHNAKCPRYFTPREDALVQDWGREVVWLNPPYGRQIGRFMAKARDEAARGALVVALVPARTDTAWFHEHVLGAAELRFLRGRVRFVGATSSAPFPSLVAIYGGPR